MLAAMMSPLISGPLRHLYDRSFARRRLRAMFLFSVGYLVAWMAAGVVLQSLTFVARLMAPGSPEPLLAAAVACLVWQASPLKQRFMNGCHRRPEIAAFGARADWAAFAYGLGNGGWCFGACWASMLLPLLLDRFHLLAMALVGLFLFAERLEAPAAFDWRIRIPRRATRILAARLRVPRRELPLPA